MTLWFKQYQKDLDHQIVLGEVSPQVKEKHQKMIGILQHERLIHLIVMLSVALFFLLTFFAALAMDYLGLWVLSGVLFILLIPYIKHYYFLENTVQCWYKMQEGMDCEAEHDEK